MKDTLNFKKDLFFIFLTLLSMLGFIATDMYLPAFKAIENSLVTTPSEVALSLTFFLGGLALGQLLYGPLVEKFGKRYSLIFGLSIFSIASLVIALSDSMMMFNIARFVQAIGACAATVIWQAVVIDKYDRQQAQKMFSNIMPLVALSPALAPVLGAYVLNSMGWESIFLLLAGLSIFMILLTFSFVQKEGVVKQKTFPKISYFSMLKNTKYVGNILIYAAGTATFFAYLTVWPYVMDKHGYAPSMIGLSFIPQTIMFIIGGYASKKLICKLGSEKSLSLLLLVMAILIFIIICITIPFNGLPIVYLLFAFSLLAGCNGAVYPIVVNNALQVFPNNSAKAAGLQNFVQVSLSFVASSLAAIWTLSGVVTIGGAVIFCSLIVFVGYKLRQFPSWTAAMNNFAFPDIARVGRPR